jgi:hypothetical protein
MKRWCLLALLAMASFSSQAEKRWTLVVMGVADSTTLPADHPAYDRAGEALRSILTENGHDVTVTPRNFGLDCDKQDCADVSYDQLVPAAMERKGSIENVLFFKVRVEERKTPAVTRQLVSVYVDLVDPRNMRTRRSWQGPGREHVDVSTSDSLPNWQAGKAAQQAESVGQVMTIFLQDLEKAYTFSLVDFHTEELNAFEENMTTRGVTITPENSRGPERQLLHFIDTRQYQVETEYDVIEFRKFLNEVLEESGANNYVLRSNADSDNRFAYARTQMPFLYAYISGSIFLIVLLAYIATMVSYRRHDHKLRLAYEGDHINQGLAHLEGIRFLPRKKIWHEWETQWRQAQKECEQHLRDAYEAVARNEYDKARADVTLALKKNADQIKAKQLRDELPDLDRGYEEFKQAEAMEFSDPTGAVKTIADALVLNPGLSNLASELEERIRLRSEEYLRSADESIKDHDYEAAISDIELALKNDQENPKALGLRDELPNWKRGYDYYLAAQSEVNSAPSEAAKKLSQVLSLNPHLGKEVDALEKQAQQAHRQGGLRSTLAEAEQLVDAGNPYSAISKLDEAAASLAGLSGFSVEKNQIQQLRDQSVAKLKPIQGEFSGKGDLANHRFLDQDEILIYRRSSANNPPGISIGYKRLSSLGRQTRLYRAGEQYMVEDQRSTNGTSCEGAFLQPGESFPIDQSVRIGLGGNPSKGEVGNCLLSLHVAHHSKGSVVVRFDSKSLVFLDRSGMTDAWLSLEEDLITQWNLVGINLAVGVIDGRLDVGCLNSEPLFQLVMDQGLSITRIAEDAKVKVNSALLLTSVPLQSGTIVEVEGLSFSLQAEGARV